MKVVLYNIIQLYNLYKLYDRLFLFVFSQNYLKDAWNVFDFVTVLGSITDILVTEINVRPLYPKNTAVVNDKLRWVQSIQETLGNQAMYRHNSCKENLADTLQAWQLSRHKKGRRVL